MKAPFNWYGGKAYMLKKILPILEGIPHQTFVDVFGGAGWIIFGKKPSPLDIYNDINHDILNFMRVLSTQPDELQFKLTLMPYSRTLHKLATRTYQTETDPVTKAALFFVASQQGYSNQIGTGWSHSKTASRRGMAMAVSRWLTLIDERLPNAIQRLRQIQLEELDFRKLIPAYDTPDTLFYLDPAYVPETRLVPNVYPNEMTYEDHVDLVDLLLTIQGKGVLSGYNNTLYDNLNWEKRSIGKYALYGSTKQKKGYKEELLWLKTT